MLMALQCAIPVFDGLFEPHNNAIIMDLLFELATWHALAKLRLHTESTVCALETSTTRLGTALRKFQSTICAEFVTRDLPSEEAARGRRKAAKAKAKPPISFKGKGKGNGGTNGEEEKEIHAPGVQSLVLQTTFTRRLREDYPVAWNL
jgi:hypothetical protein